MKKIIFIILILMSIQEISAQPDVTTWALTDRFRRKAPEYGEVREKRDDKIVAMFYWTWHTDDLIEGERVGNISEILRQYPEALYDFDHQAWKHGGKGYFWDEPLLGYYRATDPWVLRKHAEMLADAGVDVVFFDCTNGSLVWKSAYDVLMEVWSEALKDGVNVPKIAFMLPFGPMPDAYTSIKFLYEDIYSKKRNPELWFMWEGKPLIMAYDDMIPAEKGTINEELRNFFTFRPGQPDYVDGPANNRQWGWMEAYPQHGFVEKPGGGYEQVVVGVAQNANSAHGGHAYAFNAPETYSRSYTYRNGHINMPQSYLHGFNFQEQWDRALELDPDVVFVTGWNEWTAGKHRNWPPWDPYEPMAFPDQFDWERSRDIEPVKAWGQFADIYYCQLVNNVRAFKGVGKPAQYSAEKRININKPGDWKKVLPVYEHYRGNVFDRKHPGYANLYYENNTGRNDIVRAKVARDKENLYFYVETDKPMTDPLSSQHWMMLFIDIDRDKDTGWEGYDYVVNRSGISETSTTLEKSTKEWDWQQVGQIDYNVTGKQLVIKIPRKMLSISDNDEVNIEFKWNDNMQEPGNLIDFYVNGDTAPGGRFNFVYNPK